MGSNRPISCMPCRQPAPLISCFALFAGHSPPPAVELATAVRAQLPTIPVRSGQTTAVFGPISGRPEWGDRQVRALGLTWQRSQRRGRRRCGARARAGSCRRGRTGRCRRGRTGRLDEGKPQRQIGEPPECEHNGVRTGYEGGQADRNPFAATNKPKPDSGDDGRSSSRRQRCSRRPPRAGRRSPPDRRARCCSPRPTPPARPRGSPRRQGARARNGLPQPSGMPPIPRTGAGRWPATEPPQRLAYCHHRRPMVLYSCDRVHSGGR